MFKAWGQYYQLLQTDIEFVANQLKVHLSEIHLESYSKVTYLRHQELILNHLGYSKFNEDFAKLEIHSLVKIQHRPKIILFELLIMLLINLTVIKSDFKIC